MLTPWRPPAKSANFGHRSDRFGCQWGPLRLVNTAPTSQSHASFDDSHSYIRGSERGVTTRVTEAVGVTVPLLRRIDVHNFP